MSKLNLDECTLMHSTPVNLVWCDNQVPPRYYVCDESTPDQWWMSGGDLDWVKQSAEHTMTFWTEKLAAKVRDNPNTARIGGVHYMIGDENADKRGFRGYGGSHFQIQFNDGRVVDTTNLWCQGRIPSAFRVLLPDNATFTKGMTNE